MAATDTTTTTGTTTTTSGPVVAGDTEIWVEQRGTGPDVLLIGGLTDTVESWSFQLDGLSDRYHLIAFDNRGAGRTPLPETELTVEMMADDAAAILRAVGVERAHVAGFSGGAAIAQELALRHPELVRSLVLQSAWARWDTYVKRLVDMLLWMGDVAPSERAMLEAFLLFIYTPRAHDEGWVDAVIDEVLAFPHPQPPGAFEAQLRAWRRHETFERLPQISVPTLVLAGGSDVMISPRLGREVADRIPGAAFEVWPEEAHQPFQEVPDAWNERVDAFWRQIDGTP